MRRVSALVLALVRTGLGWRDRSRRPPCRKAAQLGIQRLLGVPHRGSVAGLTESGPGVLWGDGLDLRGHPPDVAERVPDAAAAGTSGVGRRLGDNARTSFNGLSHGGVSVWNKHPQQ